MILIKEIKKELTGLFESMIFLHSISQGIEMFEVINSEELTVEHYTFNEEDLRNLKNKDDVVSLMEVTIPEIYDEESNYSLIEQILIHLKEFNGLKIKDCIKTESFEETFLKFYNDKEELIAVVLN